ncbi:MAG: ABC transporter ATP-binding protein [Verrucomicrobiaceae bacterium]|nr:ABC transporter ATP-binding protein [Verrucomicrobiaceae bacterium]
MRSRFMVNEQLIARAANYGAAGMNDFLVFDNVSKHFGGTRAVDGVTLGIGRGEVFSLLGPSGCGKTTLLRMAAGFEVPDAGRILLDGLDITNVPPNLRPVNTVFQNYALFPHLSVRDNIAFGPRVAGKSKREFADDVDAMLHLVKLGEHADKKPAQLSGGQKQRVAIARALINKPQVLLLDEPLAALDLKLRQHMLAELHTIHREVGTTFIYVTHDQTEAISISDRIAVMNAGRVEQCGAPREIYESPRTGFVASFIGDTNFISGTVTCELPEHLCAVNCGALGELTARSLEPLAPGTKVRLSVRPEQWWIALEPEPLNAIRSRVEDCTYLGSESRLRVRAGDQVFVVNTGHQTSLPAPNAEVWIGFRAEDAVVLPATRGE